METFGTTTGDAGHTPLEQRFDELNNEESAATKFGSTDVTRVIRNQRRGYNAP